MSKEIKMGYGNIGMGTTMRDGKGLFYIHKMTQTKSIGEMSDPKEVGVICDKNEFDPEQESTICWFSFPTIESIDNMILALGDMKKTFILGRPVTKEELTTDA